jgi:hypothetical protein
MKNSILVHARELNRLHEGLTNSNTLIIKNAVTGLECSFLKDGFEKQVVIIKDDVLAAELSVAGVNGIIEGTDFQVFRNTFDSFSLRVKARKLYQELNSSLPVAAAA